MKYLFYIDEFEFYGGKSEPIKWEFDFRNGCVATYHLNIGMRQCNAVVYVSKKGTRKVLALSEIPEDPGGQNAVYDIFDYRMSSDGDNFQVPDYVKSNLWTREITKLIWLIIAFVLCGLGIVMAIASYLRGAWTFALIACAIYLMGFYSYRNRERIEDLFSANDDFEKIMKKKQENKCRLSV